MFTALAGYVISRLKRRPFAFEVRDLWPQSIVELGMLQNSTIINILTHLELLLYYKADLIVGVAESTKYNLISRGIPEKKICIIPNGIDINRFVESSDDNYIRERYSLKDKFVVSYIGTHGLSHSLNTVLEAANLIRNQTNIIFLFVGEGAEKEKLKSKASELKLQNILFIDQQPISEIPSFYRSSDICLVTLLKLKIFEKVLPSKIFEIMACGKPIIGALLGEAKALLMKSKAAIIVEPECPKALAEAISILISDKDMRTKMGNNGKNFVINNFQRKDQAHKYLEALQGIITPTENSIL
jgi:glycosyltransferase involved in cell wall biosynthesis